nr:MAG TPA: hypothetical protein [Caudoviricetes sp.]
MDFALYSFWSITDFLIAFSHRSRSVDRSDIFTIYAKRLRYEVNTLICYESSCKRSFKIDKCYSLCSH